MDEQQIAEYETAAQYAADAPDEDQSEWHTTYATDVPLLCAEIRRLKRMAETDG